jgi:uridine kinase
VRVYAGGMRLPTTPATTVLRGLRQEVRQHYRAGRVVLGVDGAEGAGTEGFADGLAEVFAEDGAAVYRASLAGFRRPRDERVASGHRPGDGDDPAAFDLSTLRRVLIDPFRIGGGTGFQLEAFDTVRDAPAEAQWTTAPRDAVLIVDGPFLLGPALRGVWHWTVWLEVPPAIAFARLASGGGVDADPEAASNARRRDVQRRYVRESAPRAAASAIVENSDPAHPVRVFGDFC